MILWEKQDAKVVFRIAHLGDYLPATGLNATERCNWKCQAAKLGPYFQNIDLSMANLECPIGVESCAARKKIGLGDNFSAPPASLEYLAALGVKLVGIANNHIYDYGFEGVQDAEWVVLDYEGTNYDLAVFQAQVASVTAAGYDEVASGYGLALLHKR